MLGANRLGRDLDPVYAFTQFRSSSVVRGGDSRNWQCDFDSPPPWWSAAGSAEPMLPCLVCQALVSHAAIRSTTPSFRPTPSKPRQRNIALSRTEIEIYRRSNLANTVHLLESNVSSIGLKCQPQKRIRPVESAMRTRGLRLFSDVKPNLTRA